MAPRKTTKKATKPKTQPKAEVKPSIEEEAKSFIEEKKKQEPPKELTPRRSYAGFALSGLISGGVGHTPPDEVVTQAWKWAELLDKGEP